MLAGRRIVVGVTGGIAAFKTASLVSELVKAGAEVRVIMTRAAREFVGETTFEALTMRPVAGRMWGRGAMHGAGGGAPLEDHIELARWCELVVVAPLTAHTLGRMANGLADDFLSTFLLAARAPLLLAPAMNTDMLAHPAVQRNLARVRELGAQVLLGEPGRLACGTEGPGRMAEPEEILAAVRARFSRERDLAGRRVLVAAGRTEEPLDPVRYLSNRSSGRSGAALAREALDRGARVTLVWGVADVAPPAGAEVVPVRSAADMERAMTAAFPACDVCIMAAAVADFRPGEPATSKLRREEGAALSLRLEATPDVLAALGRHPARGGKVLVGYALETGGVPEDARGKLVRKGLDLLVWNDATCEGCGIGGDTNRVALLAADGGLAELPLLTKDAIAAAIFDRILPLLAAPRQTAPRQPASAPGE